jgi:hypothetical protein
MGLQSDRISLTKGAQREFAICVLRAAKSPLLAPIGLLLMLRNARRQSR